MSVSSPGLRHVSESQTRKERVHTAMLIELLVLLVFLSMTFAFVQKDETSVSSLQSQVDNLRGQLSQANAEIARLRRENAELAKANAQLRVSLARWMDRQHGAIAASAQPILIPQAQLRELTDSLANQTAMTEERQKENAALRRQLVQARGGGSDLPICPVTAGFLVNVELYANGGMRVTPLWSQGSAPAVREISGAVELASGRDLSPAAFAQLAQQVSGWGRRQPVACGFKARVTEHHSDLALYKRQVRLVERFFYDHRS